MLEAQERSKAHEQARLEAEKVSLNRRIQEMQHKADRKRPAPMRIPMDPFTPTKRRRNAGPQSEERKPAPQSSQLSIPSTESQGNTWKPIIAEAMGQTLEQWFRHCKEQHLEIGGDARRFVEEQNYRSCLSVVNSAYPQNYPARKEAAHMFAQSARTKGIEEGTREYGALVTFYQHCCIKIHGDSKPPEASIPSQVPQNGTMAVTAKDFSDFGLAISNIMTNQVKNTLGDAANLFTQQHKAGPAALTTALAQNTNFYQLNPTDIGEECEAVLGIGGLS